MTIGTFDAKTHLSEMLDEIQKGKDYVITKRGIPIAKLIPFSEDKKPRREVTRELGEIRKRTAGESFDIREAIEEGRP
ncbi:type II toxin-antitoxin system prevent-host-death family antitoxin [Treponema primitia]|uniref:type II toxin-antitoxin system Phd/YefM family antitoxin n=1 Tax=Treponema primitia TaxID=88058 RepID=UPI00397EEE8E